MGHPVNFWRPLVLTTNAAALVTLGVLSPTGLRAQAPTPTADSTVFEVASIKLNKSGDFLNSIAFQGGRFTATNVTLRELIRVAYGIQNSQLVGGPNWIGSDRFDIFAKAEGDPTPERAGGTPGSMQLMIQRLLADRFKLILHSEMRELQAYALVMARTDRRMGPELRASQIDCAAVMAEVRARGEPSAFPMPGERQLCDRFLGFPPRFTAGGVSMTQLAMSLSRLVNRTVLDRTELSGTFDFTLQWTPEGLPQRPPVAADQPIRLNGIDIDPNGPSIFTALQEQLGLKLESTKGPVDVFVIDNVERPTPD